MPGILYLIPHSLGLPAQDPAQQLDWIIPQQVQALTARLPYFVAENAKTTRAHLKLLSQQHPLARPLQEIRIAELNVQTEAAQLPQLLQPILDGQDGGLISEAGVPAVADPGSALVRLAHQKGVTVRPLVGPSSLLMAVMASGMNGQSFAFHGYLPQDAAQRAKRMRELELRSRQEKQTQLFIETPYRNEALFKAFLQNCQPGTLLCCAVHLSLPDETVSTHTIAQWKKMALPDFQKKPCVFLMLAA
ncbi:SAM-dependent methyltransferase [Massilia sp. W12]|uniref:SAM-dependent methyltransferase n=1 Tax=Massilia sp. W12 TaxID=3126507 RepID=UPI0030CD604F